VSKAQVKYINKTRCYEVKFNLSADELVELHKVLYNSTPGLGVKNFIALCESLSELSDKHNISFLISPLPNV
jgi:hypothetical protein